MWHWPHVLGKRASSTELVCLEWHCVHVPIVPSSLGLPTAWHCSQPEVAAGCPSGSTRGFGGRLVPPGWNCSLKETCSGVSPFSPCTAAQLGAAWRLRRNS